MTRRAAPGRRDRGEVVARDGFTGLKSATAAELPDAVAVPLTPDAARICTTGYVDPTTDQPARALDLDVTTGRVGLTTSGGDTLTTTTTCSAATNWTAPGQYAIGYRTRSPALCSR